MLSEQGNIWKKAAINNFNIFLWRNIPARAQAVSMFRGSNHTQLDTHTHTHTHTHTLHPVGVLRKRDRSVAANNTHRRDTHMPPAVSEPAIPASQLPQTHAVDRAITSIEQFQLKSYIPQTKLKKGGKHSELLYIKMNESTRYSN